MIKKTKTTTKKIKAKVKTKTSVAQKGAASASKTAKFLSKSPAKAKSSKKKKESSKMKTQQKKTNAPVVTEIAEQTRGVIPESAQAAPPWSTAQAKEIKPTKNLKITGSRGAPKKPLYPQSHSS